MPGPGFKENKDGINRSGRPKKGETLTDLLKQYLEEKDEDDITRKSKLIKKVYELAIEKGDTTMIRYTFDRLDGKPTEKKEISGPDGQPISVVYDEDFKGV